MPNLDLDTLIEAQEYEGELQLRFYTTQLESPTPHSFYKEAIVSIKQDTLINLIEEHPGYFRLS